MAEKGDWRQPYDPEFEEWVWELRDSRARHPHLREDLTPLDDDEPSGDIPPSAEALQANKERERS